MAEQTHLALRKVISIIKKNAPVSKFPFAIRVIVWELMKSQTRLTKLENKMAHKKKAHMKAKACPMPMEKSKEMPKMKDKEIKKPKK